MRKIILSILLAMSALSLCSCKVNWFGESFDAPWYVIAIVIAVIAVIVYVPIISSTYVCPKCNTEIKPKWYQLSVCIHMNGERLVKCPHCGRKGFCKRKK